MISFAILSTVGPIETDWQPPIPLATLRGSKTALIPFPRRVEWGREDYTLPSRVQVHAAAANQAELRTATDSLAALLKERGIAGSFGAKAGVGSAIRISIGPSDGKSDEGYRLIVSSTGIEIVGNSSAGAFYGVQTLGQMLRTVRGRTVVQHARIDDAPAFAWRGFMHDTGRNFQEIGELKRQIDLASKFKVNLFHWHLTDNPAWRVESRIFPQLNDPAHRRAGRDPSRTYSFDDIRSVIAFAKARHVRILPELDMPGHSQYFKPAMGFEMASPEGVSALKQLIEEFCKEIPKQDCPWLHIGSDEVRIPDPPGFMREIGAKVESLGRVPVIWSPGLPNTGIMIEQPWTEEFTGSKTATILDSSAGYANFYDPLLLVQRYFFAQPCATPVGNSRALGSVLCVWPDVRVDDKRNIERHNGVWPGVLAMAEATWVGRPSNGRAFLYEAPDPDSAAGHSFREFESRLGILRDSMFAKTPFPYAAHSGLKWRVWLDGSTDATTAFGGSVLLADATRKNGLFKDAKSDLAHAETVVRSPRAQKVFAWIGFETSARSNRKGSGVPPEGQWDPFGADVWLNGVRVEPPRWNQPGTNLFTRHTWHQPPNEIPFTDEELFWTREPVAIDLMKGENRLRLRIPRGYPIQTWQFAFVPVRRTKAGRYVEETSIAFDLPKK